MLANALNSNGQNDTCTHKGVCIHPVAIIKNTSKESPYFLLLKNQKNPFDTAVAVRIDRYRQEGLKLKLEGQLIDSLLTEINGLQYEVKLADSVISTQKSTIKILAEANTRKDSVQTILKNDFDKLYRIADKENKLYTRIELCIGALIVIELAKLLIRR